MSITRLTWMGRHALVGMACLMVANRPLWAADKDTTSKKESVKSAISPGETLADGWEQLDPRYERLVRDLAAVNEELKALIGKQYSSAKHAIYSEKFKAQQADASIIRQWANGGGPISWTRFYGRTIDAFYHPGPSRTAAVFDGWGNVAVVGSQGSPTLKQRPPQFDYIVNAQEKIKADALARADALAKNLPQLEARRRELESKHIKLSCQIAFHEVKRRDLVNKQLYRFKPVSRYGDSESRKNEDSMYMVVVLMSKVVKVVDRAEENQGRALQQIARLVERGRVDLADSWARQQVIEVSVNNDKPDLRTPQGRFLALVRFLEDHAANLDESYADAMADAEAKVVSSLAAKTDRWEQLWESLVGFAQAVLAMDETAISLAEQWQVLPDLNVQLVVEQMAAPTADVALPTASAPVAVVRSSLSFDVSRLREIKIHEGKHWIKFPVSQEHGVPYIDRGGGSKTPLIYKDNTLSWKKQGGKGERRINIDDKKTANGHRVELIVKD